MNDLHYERLPPLQRPLLDKFYRGHGSPMRAGNQGQPWIARHGEIIAALCLTPIAQGHWLTGLFVAPNARRQAIASTLVRQALGQVEGPVWLFCHPALTALYQPLGFQPCPHLPAALAERLTRYSRSKTLVALQGGGGPQNPSHPTDRSHAPRGNAALDAPASVDDLCRRVTLR